jgi:hypothetical protein
MSQCVEQLGDTRPISLSVRAVEGILEDFVGVVETFLFEEGRDLRVCGPQLFLAGM